MTNKITPKLDSNLEQTKEKAREVYEDVKEKTAELYEEGKKSVSEARDTIVEYSDDLARQVKNRPLSALLIAGGIGFLLAALLRK